MNTWDVAVASLLAFVGAFLTVYLLSSLALPFLVWLRSTGQSMKLNRSFQKLAAADRLMDAKRPVEAAAELRRAVIIDNLVRSTFLPLVREHHQNILSRCVVIAEEVGGRPDNLPLVERLFIQRAELQSLYNRARDAYAKLRTRRETAGKDIPSWSKGDYEKRAKDISAELEKNLRELESALDKLFTSITTPSREHIIIH
jgi:hypothetical protein